MPQIARYSTHTMRGTLLVLLALVAATVAGPITVQDSNKCSEKTTCPQSSKFNYATGTTYSYDYRVDTATSMSGASEDSARLTLQATANIEVLSPCEFALRLGNSRLFHSDSKGGLKAADGEDQFRRSLEANTLRFSYHDGTIETVCPQDSEETWTLNIKKGVLSTLQNTMGDFTQTQNKTETDVAGTCQVEYLTPESGYYTTTVTKRKDLLSCTDRQSLSTFLHLTPYTVPSELQNLPIMRPSHECEQEIEVGGVLKMSTCSEEHMWRPFSNGRSGGVTTVKQTLKYQTYRRGVSTRQSAINTRDSLTFVHEEQEKNTRQARAGVEQKLAEICASTSRDIRPESPRLFTELVKAMTSMDKQDMEDVHKLLKTKSMCPTNDKTYKFFLDALPMTSTDASVKLMTSLMTNGDVKDMQAKAWMASLAFIQTPESDMLLDVKALIDDETLRRDALLPVSAMVNNYCRKTASCNEDYPVLSIMASLERNIGSRCDVNKDNFEKILLSLRAIGNAGHTTRTVPVLNRCLTEVTNPLEIRVAAADAFRRMPCDAEDDDLWSTFKNAEMDSELRIAAYLALMRCPSESNLGKIASILSRESDEQVGAFVYSHLTNLRQTSDPHKQDVAQAINNLALDKEFDISPLKFSRNFEASILMNKINTGFVAESNLVWSSVSQMPRSVSGNLTVDLFGHAVNLLDFGGRLEGLEYLIKNLFGSYMTEDSSDQKFKNRANADDVEGSIYGRIFGNELLFVNSKSFQSPLGKLPNSWLDMLIQLSKKQDYTLTQSAEFLNFETIIPTSAGLPLTVDVNGTATVDLVLSGKMDLRKLGSSPRSLDIDGEIRPSAAMEITGTMSVDAFVTKTGLRMRNVLHSSTSMKGRIQLERGQLLNIEIDTPEDKIEIFDASSKFFIMHDNLEQEQAMITENRKQFKVCTGDKVATISGMELCGEISFPNASMKTDSPHFPLTGPTSASVTLYKRDSHSGYKLFAKRVENKKASIAQISFNTPGSRTNRAILTEMSMNYVQKEFEALMATPWKKATLRGAVINTKDMKSLSGSLVVDETDTYAMTSELKMIYSKGKLEMNPMVELRRPGADNIQLSGFINIEKPYQSMDLDLSVSGLQPLPYVLKTSIINKKALKSLKSSFSPDGKQEYSIEASNELNVVYRKAATSARMNSLFKVNTPKREVTNLQSSLDYKSDKSLKFDGSMSIYRVLKKPATFRATLLKSAKKRGTRYDIDLLLKSTAISGRVDHMFFRKTSGFMSMKTILDYTIPRVDKNKITFSGKFNDQSTKAYNKYTVKSNLDNKKNPDYNLGLSVGVDHKKKQSRAEMELKYGANPKDKINRIYLFSFMNKKITNLKNAMVNYKIQAEAPAQNVDVLLTGKHKHTPRMMDSTIDLNYGGKNKVVSAGVKLSDKSTKLMKMNGAMNVAWPGQKYTVKTGLNQKSPKTYSHVINLMDNSGTKHTVSTIYEMPKAKTHSVNMDIDLHDMKPVNLAGSTTLDPMKFQASGQLKTGKDKYGLSAITKMSKSPAAKVMLELVHPERRMTLVVDGGKSSKKYDGSVEAAWDADNDKSQKITLGGNCHHKSTKNSVSLGGNLAFTSPFKGYDNLMTSFKYGSDNSQHDIDSKISWGGKSNQIVSSMNIKKPISWKNVQLSVEAKTPFRGFRVATADIAHTMDPTLNTMLQGTWEKESAKLSIQGENNSDMTTRNLKGTMALKSSIKNAENVKLDLAHIDGNGRMTSNAALVYNGKTYAYDMNMDHSQDGWQVKNKGDVIVELPQKKITTSWQHKNTDSDIQSSFTSDWGKDRMAVDLSASHDLSSVRTLQGTVKVQTPFSSARNVAFALNHKNGEGLINSNFNLKRNGNVFVSSILNYKRTDNAAEVEVDLTTPYMEDINAKVNTHYDVYPMTGTAEISWAPRKKAVMEGSLNAAAWDNANVDLKLTTPFRQYRNIVFKAANKKEGEEMISHMNLDYGVRKNIDMESRVACTDNQKLLRLKMMTPFDEMKSLDTGMRFDGSSVNFVSSADFELVPIVGKIQGSVNWDYSDDLTGKLRIDTPFPEYPYFEMSTSSQDKGRARQSRIEAEYYPRQAFSLDTTYTLDLPFSFEATVNSPFPDYDNLGVSFQHQHSPSSIVSHGEVTYQPNKKIEGDLSADWSSDIEGNILIKTPFAGYETSKASLRHQGNMNAFSSRGEINVAEKSLVAEGNFNSGYTTTGVFTFSSPIPGMESVELSMKKKGNQNNFRGDAVFKINDESAQTNFNYRLTSKGLKSGISVQSPFTENFKFTLDHTGVATSFNNKMSVNYGRAYDIDTIAAFDLRDPDVSGNGMIKYKLGGGRNTVRVIVSKNGFLDDMTFSGTASYNRNDINVNGSWKTLSGIEGSMQIKTPFDDFSTVGMTLSHTGSINDFRSSANINYMDNKNIHGKLEASYAGLDRIRFSSELYTPFDNLESTVLKLDNDYDGYTMALTGNAALTTTLGGFGSGSLAYSKTGDLNNLGFEASANMNGKEMTRVKLTNSILAQEIHSKVDFRSEASPNVLLTFDHIGDMSNFNSKAYGMLGRSTVSGQATFKQGYDNIDADGSFTYRIDDFGRNKGSVSFHKDGDLNRFNMMITGKLAGEEGKISLTKRGPIDDLNISGTASYNNDAISVDGTLKNLETLDASLQIKTPFDDYKNIGMQLTHVGELTDFTSKASVTYMDYKQIMGKVGLSADGISRVRFSSEMSTPFENFRSGSIKFNNDYDQYTMGLTGNIAMTTTIGDFGSGSMKYSKTGDYDNLVLEASALLNGDEFSSIKITNNMLEREVHSVFNLKTIMTPEVMLTLDHVGDMYDFNTKARGMVGKNNIVSSELTLSQRGDNVDASGKVMYVISEIGNNQGSVIFHKEGQVDDFSFRVVGKYDNKESTLNGAFKVKDELTGSLSLNTPFRGYRNIGMSLKHSGNLDRFNSEAKMNLADGEQYSGKIDFYRYLFRRIEATAELRTPIYGYEFTKYEYRHEGADDSFKCYATLEYGNSQKITYDLTANMVPSPDFSVTLKTPFDNYEELMASASLENRWPKFGVNCKLNAGNNNVVTLAGAFDASNDIIGSLTLSTPVEDFTDVGMSFQHSGPLAKFNSKGRITYMDGKDISGKVNFRLRRTFVSAELNTPFPGYEFTKYEYKHSQNDRESSCTSTLNYSNGKVISSETIVTFMPKPGMSFTIKTPFTDYEEMMASASVTTEGPKYELESKLNAGAGNVVTLNGVFDVSRDVSGSINLETPVYGFNSVGMSFYHSGNDQKFASEGKITYMDGKDIIGNVNFYRYRWRRVVASADLSTPFTGMENTKAEINFEDNSNSISTTAALEYNQGQKLNGNLKFTYSPNYDVLVTLNTPFYDYRVIRAQGSMDLTAPRYGMSYNVNYGYNKAFSANGKLNLYSANNIDGSLEITTPAEGFEFTKMEYAHKTDFSRVDGSASITYGNGKVISGDLKSTISPSLDATATMRTPFYGYERMQGTVTYDSSYQKYDMSSSLNLGRDVYSMTSELDYSVDPMKASTKISTPYADYRNVELVITHAGVIDNFMCTAFFASPLTDNVNAQASLKYNSPFDVTAAASLKSAMEGMDDLKFELKNSDISGEKKTHSVIGWTSGQQVTTDVSFRQQESWYEDTMHTDLSLTTPFIAMRSLSLQTDHTGKQDGVVEKITFELNGDQLLDMDTVYSSKKNHEVSVVFRQPWPMQYTASTSSDDGVTGANVFANWNRDEWDSNVRLTTTMTSKSDDGESEKAFEIGVEHAARKVSVVQQYSSNSAQTTSSGKITWDTDSDSKVYYEVQLNDNSRRGTDMYDGTFKLGFPSRTVGVVGSYSDNRVTKVGDATFSWDLDGDTSKQVGLTTSLTQGDRVRGDVTLKMPAINKEIHVDAEVIMNNGRVILDTKTDISYSADYRNTLTLTSKLEDVADMYSGYNYSLELGLKHPQTKTDIKMTSHLGSSDELMTMGMKTTYLTARRQLKNLALLTEINKLKKQINFQVWSPVSNVQVMGDVLSTSPYKVRVVNKIDDFEVFRSDLSMDKRSLVLNAYMDSESLTFAAKYPNSTAFTAEISRNAQDSIQREALLGVRLNTSRLLHTRLSWQPGMMTELNEFIITRMAEKGLRAKEVLSEANEAVSEEISAKYRDITSTLNEELKPLIDILNQEMAIVALQMKDMSDNLRAMYQRNDFYIQDMGEGVTEMYIELQENLEKLTEEYRVTYTQLIGSLRNHLDVMVRYPIGQAYTQYVHESALWLSENMEKSLTCLDEYLAKVDATLQEYKTKMQEWKDSAMDTAYLDYISNKIDQIPSVNMSSYVPSFQIPEEYTNAIYSANDAINTRLQNLNLAVLERPEIRYVKEGMNEVYQQGAWAYKYWDVENNMKKHAESILTTLREILEYELQLYSMDVRSVYKNPITVWDPQNGEIQADIPLPFEVQRLDQMPDMTPLFDKAEHLAAVYLPDQTTWNNMVESVSNLVTPEKEVASKVAVNELKSYKPSKKVRKSKTGRKYRMRKYRQ